MVNWTSPAELALDGAVFLKLMHVLLGIYIWEWFTSLPYDWLFISGQKPFRIPMVPYFLNRYCMLLVMIGIAIALNVTTEVNCQALYTFNQVMGDMCIGLASMNLAVRCMAIWMQKLYIVIPLILLMIGHWAILLDGIQLRAIWDPAEGCVVVQTNNAILSATYIYAMTFDFIVLVLTGIRLVGDVKVGGSSRLVNLIFQDGLVYFIIAFMANLMATTFILLNLNPVMSVITNVPAAMISTTVACRVVRRLSNYGRSQEVEVYANNSKSQATSMNFRANANATSTTNSTGPTALGLRSQNGVHIQMDTLEKFDSAGNPINGFDVESQSISGDFKHAAL